ncbi:hypothetical protein VRU48_05650 [Pedobacter sp. KR3-3]|uniref:Uncharacterized protein n=1 Tax=Pedobacter albus TaxID=3113905 RepID=A0ABU7I543_9SPHI|nr:hypothetical protein [Pedobacter sp. KR3-3]MEE1944582.1 hypothetical protein [Pedobacter sp. KR3-3]
MKYHYQFVSKTIVRIELIPEDQKETALIKTLSSSAENDPNLKELFKKGFEAYDPKAELTKLKFMNFPSVALCSYASATEPINQLHREE